MKRSIFISLLFILIFICFSCVKTEVEITGNINGIIKDASTNAPLEGCVVCIQDTSLHKSISNEKGVFSLRDVIMGRKQISIVCNGYISLIDTIVVQASQTNNHDFTLTPISAVVIQTRPATDIDYTSARLCASIINDGGGNIIERGFYFERTIGELTKIKVDNENKEYTYAIDDLSDGNTYLYAAYAINEKGEVIGTKESFQTFSYSLPSVRTISATNIQCDAAVLSGEISASGNSDVKEYGIFLKKKDSNTYLRYPCDNLNNGRFSLDASNLSDGTDYIYKAYAVNKKGEECGEEMSFRTIKLELPVVVTGLVSDIQYTSFLVQGSITSNGGAPIESKGVCYSTTPEPDINSDNIPCGTGIENFDIRVQQLLPNTKYYIKAYAKNRVGCAYGSQVEVTTKAYSIPSVTTSNATDIELRQATIGGNVIDNGGQQLSERGICYNTSSTPTIANNKIPCGSNEGAFSVNLSDLSPGTTYYVRAYAVNTAGVGYGNQVVFQTQQYALPTLSSVSVTNIDLTSADLGCSITSDGGVAISACGFCISESHTPTIYNSLVIGGNLQSSLFSCTVAQLKYNTTYYVRAYATNVSGTSYSAEKSFKTSSTNLYFSISATEKVLFSPGNLQYCPSTKTWQFANSQTSYIGQNNSNISSTYTGWIDLFGYGTGKNPTQCNTVSTSYDSFSEWGNHVIGNDPVGTWRTLTSVEWSYLLEGRSNASSKYSMARVANIKGIILLPDNWSAPSGISFVAGATTYSSNIYSAAQWSQMEAKGAVFLPAAGARLGTTVNSVGEAGCYWKNGSCAMAGSSDYYGQALIFDEGDPNNAFDTPGVSSTCGIRYAGYSVRLIKVLQ